MSEMEFAVDRQVVVAWLGTGLSTILPAVPPQMSMELLGVRYAMPAAQGTATALLLQTPDARFAGGPFSSAGTVVGTIDVAALDSSSPTVTERAGEVFTLVSPGFALSGLTLVGSVLARITWTPRYGRR